MSKKDLKTLDKMVSALSFDLAIKLGAFDNISEGKKILELFDKKKTVAQERKEEREAETPVFIQPMATYVCPKCKKAGYLFLPNIDTEASQLLFNFLLYDSFFVCVVDYESYPSPSEKNYIYKILNNYTSKGILNSHSAH